MILTIFAWGSPVRHCSPIILWLPTVCTVSDLSSSNFSNWIWWNTFGSESLCASSSKSHYAPHSIFEEALIDKKIKRGKSSNIFHICWPNMHHSMCSLLLCKSNMDNVESELKACWNIDNLSVPCLLLIKACTHKNVEIKKSETGKPIQKHSWLFPPKSIVQPEILKWMIFRFLTFLLISCPIESSKSKLGPSAFIPYVAKSPNYQNMKVSVFCQILATLGSTALWGRHI